MAKIINQNQQITTGVLQPASIYSRQVGIEVIVPTGVGADGYGYTPPLGTNLWLLGVDIYMFGVDAGIDIGGFLHIKKGSEEPKSASDITNRWESVMQYVGIKPSIYWWSTDSGHFHWDMNKLYTGETVRFAFVIENFSAVHGFAAHAWFQISEG